jgi:tRNA(Ile)-lysidine synthase
MAGASGLTAAKTILKAVQAGIPSAGRFLVALSGGADSAVVAWAVAEAARPGATRGVHVHHGGRASGSLAAAALAVADHVGIALTRVDVEVPEGASFENQARHVRLAAISEIAAAEEWLVTGHHEGDSVETVFNNLLRGAGATGLSGIGSNRGSWLRPLVNVEATTVRAAAVELGLPFIEDPANTDQRHRRNVIRAEVVPWLSERFDIPVGRVVSRSAGALAADDASLEDIAGRIPVGSSAGATVIPAVVLSTVPRAIAARVARRALRRAHPPYPGSSRDVDAVLSVAVGSARRLSLSGGLTAEREGPLVAIYGAAEENRGVMPFRPGQAVQFGPWHVHMSEVDAPARPNVGRSRVLADAASLAVDAVVRSGREGERIDLVEGSKPIRDAMAEVGIPLRLRSAWPVVAVGAKIAWVAGVRPSAFVVARPAAGEPFVELSIEGIAV